MGGLLVGRFRADLVAAAVESSCLAFEVALPPGLPAVWLTRELLTLASAGPVVFITLLFGFVHLLAYRPFGPAPDSFLGRLNWLPSYVIPLGLVAFGLVVHAIRDRLPAYAFTAGLVTNLAVTGAYSVAFLRSQTVFESEDVQEICVRLLQLGVSVAAGWLILWLIVRSWFWSAQEQAQCAGSEVMVSGPTRHSGRRSCRLARGGGGFCRLSLSLVIRVVHGNRLLVELAGPGPDGDGFYTSRLGPTLEIPPRCRRLAGVRGGHLGGFYHRTPGFRRGSWLSSVDRCLVGIFAALAGGNLVVSMAIWRPGTRRSLDSDGTLVAAGRGHGQPGVGVKVAFWHDEQLWAAAGIALTSLATATFAARRRRDDWAFLAGLGANSAASLVVWHYYSEAFTPFSDWWVPLAQANLTASALVLLIWLALRLRFDSQTIAEWHRGFFLLGQLALIVIGNGLLLLYPALYLFGYPGGPLPEAATEVGNLWGWLAFLLAMSAAGWYLVRAEPGRVLLIVVGLGMGSAVLAASCVCRIGANAWSAYHLMLYVWVLTPLVVLVLPSLVERTGFAWNKNLAPTLRLVRASFWLMAILIACYALRAGEADDPGNPYWAAGAGLSIGLIAGYLATRPKNHWTYLVPAWRSTLSERSSGLPAEIEIWIFLSSSNQFASRLLQPRGRH